MIKADDLPFVLITEKSNCLIKLNLSADFIVYIPRCGWAWICGIRRHLLQTIYLLDNIYMNQWHEQQDRKISSADKTLNHIHTNLIHIDLKLDESAEAFGYRYSFYFDTQFTKTVGMTPNEYRKQNRI